MVDRPRGRGRRSPAPDRLPPILFPRLILVNALLRPLLLRLSESRTLRRAAPRLPLVRRAVRRFVPGETLAKAAGVLEQLEGYGMNSVLTYLGENVVDPEGAARVMMQYRAALGVADEQDLGTELSVKPSQLGLDLSMELCRGSVETLARESDRREATLWIDMEQSPYVEPTLDLVRALSAKGRRVGVCLQAYLRRTPADMDELLPLEPAIRLVKGAYREPSDLALQRKEEVDERFLELGVRLLRGRAGGSGVRIAFATHDGVLVRQLQAEARALGLSVGDYEFQMLYGIRGELARTLADEGERVGILLSYGEAWFPWYMRRLAERPANLLFLMKGLGPGASDAGPEGTYAPATGTSGTG